MTASTSQAPANDAAPRRRRIVPSAPSQSVQPAADATPTEGSPPTLDLLPEASGLAAGAPVVKTTNYVRWHPKPKPLVAAPPAAATALGNKRDVVLAIGLEEPSADIVAAAASQGVTVTRQYVAILKKRAGAGSSVARRTPSATLHGAPKAKTTVARPVASSAPEPRTRDMEAAFRSVVGALVVAHGVGHVRTLLAAIEAKLLAAGAQQSGAAVALRPTRS